MESDDGMMTQIGDQGGNPNPWSAISYARPPVNEEIHTFISGMFTEMTTSCKPIIKNFASNRA